MMKIFAYKMWSRIQGEASRGNYRKEDGIPGQTARIRQFHKIRDERNVNKIQTFRNVLNLTN